MIFVSCQQEEMVTSRNYPFVISLGTHTIDGTGASVDFEVLDEGKIAITSYGVEYFESSEFQTGNNTNPISIIEKTGIPSSEIETIRIDYDLIVGKEYIAKPFVNAGNVTVYGESLLFNSKGIKAPEIKAVSDSILMGSTELTITGDYFNSRLENNQIEIPGLEDYFKIELSSVTRSEIKFKLKRTYLAFPFSERKYSLRLTSGGKTIVLTDYFSIGYPSIESISPLVGYVGDEIKVKFNAKTYLENTYLYLNYGAYPSAVYPIEPISNDEYVLLIDNLPPGKYPITLTNNEFIFEYPDQLEVLSSWEVYKNSTKIPADLLNYRTFIVGDKLIYWKEGYGDFQETYIYDLKADYVQKIDPKPNNTIEKGSVVTAAAQGRYLYYGLGTSGNFGNVTNHKDFSRLDLNTGKWENLPQFPMEDSRAYRSFEYMGKIMVGLPAYENFYVFDPQSMTWSESQYKNPEILRYSNYQLVVKDEYIYYMIGSSENEIYRLKLGEQAELIATSYWANTTPKLTIQGNSLFLTYWTSSIFEINLETKKKKPIQALSYTPYSEGIPWGSSEGFLFAFLHDGGNVKIDEKIYKLKH
tara:strand:+ start:3070 stop:4821 length:1752 start_codon:yes stop_codon:yes gene_type:complete